MVPFAAGGPTDMMARTLGERMRATLGQTLLIENVTGAGGSIGVGRAVQAAPDGYTISIGQHRHARGQRRDLSVEVRPARAISSRSRCSPTNPMVVVAKTGDAGAEPARADRLVEGEPGQGRGGHRRRRLRLAYLPRCISRRLTGTKFNFVPYRGTGPALAGSRRRADRHDRRPGFQLDGAGAGRQDQGVRGRRRTSACRPLPTSRPSTRPDCRDSTFRSGPRSGYRKARRGM